MSSPLSLAQPPQPPLPFSLRLSDEQRVMLEPVRRYARERLHPLLGDAASERQRHDARQAAQQLGLASALMSERDGGLAISPLEMCLLLEELAGGPLALAAELTVSLPALAISRHHEWLAKLLPIHAETLLSEQQALPLAIAAPGGDGTFVLLPRQPCGLLALTPSTPGAWRLRWLDPEAVQGLVQHDSHAHNASGLRLARMPPAEHIHGTGFSSPVTRDASRTMMLWQGLWLAGLLAGAARAATAFAFAYTQGRTAFRHPLIHHQAVALKLADMATATDALRLQVWDLAVRLHSATILPDSHVLSAAKQIVSASLEIHRHAVQVCGGHGYVEGFPPSRRFQDARLLCLVLLDLAETLADLEPPARSNAQDLGAPPVVGSQP